MGSSSGPFFFSRAIKNARKFRSDWNVESRKVKSIRLSAYSPTIFNFKRPLFAPPFDSKSAPSRPLRVPSSAHSGPSGPFGPLPGALRDLSVPNNGGLRGSLRSHPPAGSTPPLLVVGGLPPYGG